MKKLKEVIVVEGKDDTKRIKQAVNADTIETNGSAISPGVIEQIKILQEKRGVIVFTDPDFSGEKIRQMISQQVPGVKHAFLTKAQAVPKAKGSLGVEHAAPEAIQAALAHLYTEAPAAKALVSRETLWQAGLLSGPGAKEKRAKLGEVLKIGYTNGKRLYERLSLFQINQQQLQQALEQIKQLEDKTDGE